MARQVPGLRRVEHLHRGDHLAREQPGAGSRRRTAARKPAPARGRHPRKRTPPARPGQHGGEPRAGRRHGARVARAAGRRTGNREIDPLAPDRPRGKRAQNALRLGRGVGRADQDARNPHRDRQRGVSDLPRDAARTHRRTDRRAAARPGGHRLDPDDLHRADRLVGRQRVADPRMRRHPAQIRQIDRNVDHHHRPHHQGRDHRRPEDPRAHRRCRPAVRRRQQQRLPHPARHQEPLRRNVRDRRVRDARRRAARRGQPRKFCSHTTRSRCRESPSGPRPTGCVPT